MNEEFTYEELVNYLKGKSDHVLREKIDARRTSDEEFSKMLDNLQMSLPLISAISKIKRKEKFNSWMKETDKGNNTIIFFRIAASVLILISIGTIYFLSSKKKIDNSGSITENRISIDSNAIIKDTIKNNTEIDMVESVVRNDTLNNKLTTDKNKVNLNNQKERLNESEIVLNRENIDKSMDLAINDNIKEEYLNTYEFDNISIATRGSSVDAWKFEARMADSLYNSRQFQNALDNYIKLNTHPEIYERLAFTYGRLRDYAKALEYYEKYKVLQVNKDESDWGEWLILLKAYPKFKDRFIKKTEDILLLPTHKYYQKVKDFKKRSKLH